MCVEEEISCHWQILRKDTLLKGTTFTLFIQAPIEPWFVYFRRDVPVHVRSKLLWVFHVFWIETYMYFILKLWWNNILNGNPPNNKVFFISRHLKYVTTNIDKGSSSAGHWLQLTTEVGYTKWSVFCVLLSHFFHFKYARIIWNWIDFDMNVFVVKLVYFLMKLIQLFTLSSRPGVYQFDWY